MSKLATTTTEKYSRKNRPFRTNNLSDLAVTKNKMETQEETSAQTETPDQGTLFTQGAKPAVKSAPKSAKQKSASPSGGKTTPDTMKKTSKAKSSQPVVDLTVRPTKDYSMFYLNETNRPIRKAHVKELVANIGEKNLLHSFPIIVSSSMEVLDGQHRLEAAKQLGETIYYMIDDTFDIEDIAVVNSTSKNWVLDDYLHHYTMLGNKEYEQLKRFVKEYRFNIYTAIGLLAGRSSQPNTELIKDYKSGKFKVKSWEHAVKVASVRDKMAPYAPNFFKSKNFVNALSKLARSRDFSEEELIKKVSLSSDKVHQCATVDGYTNNLLEVYNYRTRNSNKLRLEE